MSSAQDPFYIVKEEIQQSIDKLLSSFQEWEHSSANNEERLHLYEKLLSGCESTEWQVVELDKAISVASSNPARFGIDTVELEKRRRWTRAARDQVATFKRKISAGKGGSYLNSHLELMRLPADNSHHSERSNRYGQDNEDFISSESDRQLLLIRQQDEELDVLSESVKRIGSVGLTIHDELLSQEKIIDDLGNEMDSTSNRLEFLQKKVEIVMKKAGAKGQFMMILFLVVLFIVLFVLVFFT